MDYRLVFLLVLCTPPWTEGYGGGAPVTTCESMRPSHGLRSSYKYNRDSDFTIKVSGDGTYRPGQRLDVKIEATDWRTFKGFLLQARRIPTRDMADPDFQSPVGAFTAKESSTKLQCANGALTHNTGRERRSIVETVWTPPREAAGDIMFVATIVASYNSIYMNITSPIIHDATILQRDNAANTSPASLNGTAVIDPAICAEDLLLPLPLERPHVAVLCTDDSQCPCSWRCCSRCDATTSTCEGHAICRQPRPTNETNTLV